MRDFERRTIKWYLDQTDQHVGRAAELAGVDTSFFYKKIRELGISRTSKETDDAPASALSD